jgi:geranylgeranyl pyrophosphate synthase
MCSLPAAIPRRVPAIEDTEQIQRLMDDAGPAMVIPLRASAGGIVVLLRRRGAREFSADHLDMMVAFADQAALAWQLATSRQRMHELKTGALLSASVMLGGLVVGMTPLEQQALEVYAGAIGLAFQVVDDILDVTVDTAQLGKTAGKDAAANKPTYVTLMGLEQARAFAGELHQRALAALHPLGDSAALLAGLADFIVLRDH